jgi:hypothetical protein
MDSLEIRKPDPVPSALAAGLTPSPSKASCCSTASFSLDVVRSWIGNRRLLAVIGLALGGTGLGVGWDWLTAVGIAPLIVSAAPCLLMCALGLCMMGRGHQANAGKADIAPSESATRTDLPAS